MKQKNFTLPFHPGKSWSGYLSKLVALVLLVGGLGATQQAWGQSALINNDAISLSYQPTASTSSTNKSFAGSAGTRPFSTYTKLAQSSKTNQTVPSLGTYDLNSNSVLTLTGAQLRGIVGDSGTNVTATRLQYRVYLQGAGSATIPLPDYTNLTLTTTQNSNDVGAIFTGAGSVNINLLNGLTSGGNYVIDVRFQADINDGNGNTATSTDLQGGDYFYATFYITPPAVTPPGGTTIWQSTTTTGGSTDWTLAANWSNGVPNAQANAIIPAKDNTTIVYPILDSSTQNYSVLNLTLNGSGATASQLTVKAATLRVYGDLNQRGGGLAGATTGTNGALDNNSNSTLIFAGNNQLITGTLSFSDIIIAGTGIKSVINSVKPTNIIAFQPTSSADGVLIQSAAYDITGNIITSYSFDTSGNSNVDLTNSGIISTVNGQGETATSYIKGVAVVNRSITTQNQGIKNTFGNIGLDVTSNHAPGNLYIYRVVGEALQGPASTAVPIKRRYRIEGDDDSGSSASANSTLDLVFHYFPSLDELNGISENNLTMFRTINNGVPYTALGGTVDLTNHTVTRLAAPSLNKVTVTLGDKNNPLPVSLVAFNAVRSGANTLLSWTTASEENNKGFNVQVSADGVVYRTLTFVASQSPNSSNELNYKYTDTEAGKAGTRYYRLEQVDMDGKLNYSPVRAVGFDGAAATAVALVAYPNPFGDTIGLTVEGATFTEGAASVKLVDMTGRTVIDQKLSMNGASLTLGDLSNLRSGLYLAKVTLPDGSVQTVRVQKQ